MMPPSLKYRLLSSRIIIFTLFATSSLIVFEYYIGRLPIGVDQLRQYEAAKSLISGHGLSTSEINFNDLSSPLFKPLSAFPPGISVITAPLFLISDDIRIVQLIFSLSNFFIFLICTVYLLNILTKYSLSIFQFACIFLFISVNGTFLTLAGSSDLVNLNLVLIATIALLKSYTSHKPLRYIITASFFSVLTVYFRYAYFPVLLVVPLFFAIRSVLYKTKEWREAFISSICVAMFSIPILGHIFYINSQTGYIQDKAGEGFQLYWENLARVSPFPFHGFFDVIPLLRALGYASDYGYDRGYSYPTIVDYLFYFGSLLILVPLIIQAIKILKRRHTKSPIFISFWFGMVISVVLISLVYVGSLINPSQLTVYSWSWVKVFRYFIAPVYFIQLGYFLILVKVHQKLQRSFVALVITLSFLYSASLKIYNYTANYIPFNFYHNITFIGSNDMQLNSYRIHEILPSNDNHTVVLYGKSLQNALYNPKYFFALNNATSSFIDDVPNLKTSESVEVFVIVTSKDTDAYAVIDKYEGKKYAEIDNDISIHQFTLHR